MTSVAALDNDNDNDDVDNDNAKFVCVSANKQIFTNYCKIFYIQNANSKNVFLAI